MILDALLALGIVMSSATQLVVPHVSSTIGELALLLWILLSLTETISERQLHVTPALARIVGFWLLLAILTSLGVLVGYTTTILYKSYVVHDAMAYVLLALVTCLAAAKPDAARHLRQCAWFVVGIAGVTFLIQFLLGLGLFQLPKVNPWYWNRFRGWSQNPNQLALYCAMYGPIALHLATTAKTSLARMGGTIGLILPVIAGLMTKSDTYVISALLTGLIFVGVRMQAWFSSDGRATVARQVAILVALATIPLFLSIIPYSQANIGGLVTSVTRDRGGLGIEETTERRRELWGEALEKGLSSYSLGLGPGPHLETRPLNEPLYEVNPFEAHNTFFDLYVQGGMLAVCLFIWIVGSAGVFAWRAKLAALFALAITVALFAIPHLIIRHPIVWFSITLCLVTGSARTRPATLSRTLVLA